MKHKMIALFLLPLVLAGACKRDDDGGTTPDPNPGLLPDRISRIVRQDAVGATFTRITYKDAMVDSVIEEGPTGYTAAFKHNGTTTTRIFHDPPSTTIYDTFSYDGAGRLAEVRRGIGTTHRVQRHLYDSEGRKIRTLWAANREPRNDTTDYSWSGGNLVKQEVRSSTAFNLDYTFYADKPFAAGDVLYLEELLFTGRIPTRSNTNLCQTVNYHSVAGTDSVTYTFTDGRITGRRNSFRPLPYTETYEYLPK